MARENFAAFKSLVSMSFVVVVLVALMGYCSCSSGVQYAVGDSPWTIPPYPSYFSNWSSSHFFKIGDSLVFDFETGRYDVIQVSRQDYEMCTVWNPIRIFYGGPAIIPLTDAGVLYFICNFSNYCSLGLKISVSVHRPTVPSAPSPAPTSTLPLPPPLPSLAGPNPPNGNDGAPPATRKKSSASNARSGDGIALLLVGFLSSFLVAVFV